MLEQAMREHENYLSKELNDDWQHLGCTSPEEEEFEDYLRKHFKSDGEWLQLANRGATHKKVSIEDIERINIEDLISVDEEAKIQAYQIEGQDPSSTFKNTGKSEGNTETNFLEIANDVCGKIPSNKYKAFKREPTIWEFIVRLLEDNRTNPNLISWEDREKVIFKLEKED